MAPRIPPPSVDVARDDLERALAENKAAAERGERGPYGAGAILLMEKRVDQAERAAALAPV